MDGFEQVIGKIDGQCLRELRIRENWYLPPAGTGGGPWLARRGVTPPSHTWGRPTGMGTGA
ncbi:MAG: hypothetical protein K6V36_17070, partial [Anaerolineae bacterium]|nr:hypothetical protein [Anaerolineae bacterium]